MAESVDDLADPFRLGHAKVDRALGAMSRHEKPEASLRRGGNVRCRYQDALAASLKGRLDPSMTV